MKKFSSTMRGNSRRTSRIKRIQTIVFCGAIAVFVVVVLPVVLRGAIGLVMKPVVVFDNWLATSEHSIPAYFQDRTQLVANIASLEQRLAIAELGSTTLQYIQQENDDLRALLGETNQTRIGAAVIARPPETPYDVLVLDQGTQAGVAVGAPVYVGPEVVIGTVTTVFSDTSVVSLVTTPGHESTVFVLGSNIYTTAVGRGGGVMEVGVPQGINLQVGDSVVIPAFSGGIYGVIASVDSVPTRPEQYGYVTTNIPLQNIRYVSVGEQPLGTITFAEARTIVEAVKDSLAVFPVPEGVLVDVTDATSSATTTATSTELSNEPNI